MKIALKKKQLKRLTLNEQALAKGATPAVVGGNGGNTACGTSVGCHFAKQLLPTDTRVNTVPITF
ncbi:hypothetical protein C1E23_07490 [Pseudoalteromonas phenolica]|uniref:Uncharacterized protein n=1 Tax=Pseudoalteromonas phenolica TaxID=161398 RepID=A0A4Q7IPH5_9GAMM|nr:hypothetical protein [Pseudoalteromonas phenolica]RZQ53712.1 hypothetical protein C1E23_07490 [Pseudoalteromonas phenolica]